MKRLLVVILAVGFVLGMTAVALASGYRYNPPDSIPNQNEPPPDGTGTDEIPHEGYLTSTNYCKFCHAVHQASGSYRLIINATSADDMCNYCHTGASPKAVDVAYTSAAPNAADNAHTIGVALNTAPDGGTGLSGNLTCNKCHSVHGANTYQTEDILRADPSGNLGAPATNEIEYCGDCHYYNVSGQDTHPYGGVKAGVAWQDSYTCRDCHTDLSDYPHVGSSHALLGTGQYNSNVTSANLDAKCLECHRNSTDTQGVGKTY